MSIGETLYGREVWLLNSSHKKTSYRPKGLQEVFGGPSLSLIEQFHLSFELSEIIEFNPPKTWDNLSFLTHLYVKKRYSLRRISRELGCSKTTVRKKLRHAGIGVIHQKAGGNKALVDEKLKKLREQGRSYQEIADMLNLWRVDTRSGSGKWHSKTVRAALFFKS